MQKTQELVTRLKERREKKANGDDTKVSYITPKVVIKSEPDHSEALEAPIKDTRVTKAVGIPSEAKPVKPPAIKLSSDSSESSEDNHYHQKVSYPA